MVMVKSATRFRPFETRSLLFHFVVAPGFRVPLMPYRHLSYLVFRRAGNAAPSLTMNSCVETVWPTPWRQSILRHAAAVSIVLAQSVAEHRIDQSLKRLPKSAYPRKGPAQTRNAAPHEQGKASG
jgi:hypothetical protein